MGAPRKAFDTATAQRMYGEGASLAQIAQHLGIRSSTTVRTRLAEVGTVIRPQGGRRSVRRPDGSRAGYAPAVHSPSPSGDSDDHAGGQHHP